MYPRIDKSFMILCKSIVSNQSSTLINWCLIYYFTLKSISEKNQLSVRQVKNLSRYIDFKLITLRFSSRVIINGLSAKLIDFKLALKWNSVEEYFCVHLVKKNFDLLKWHSENPTFYENVHAYSSKWFNFTSPSDTLETCMLYWLVMDQSENVICNNWKEGVNGYS